MRLGTLALAAIASTAYASGSLAGSTVTPLSPSDLNRTVSVTLPDSQHVFPPGAGAEIANSQCMICHSAGMVTRQPPLSMDIWKSEINKMRAAYGAPIPEEQVDALAKYLTAINGKR
ncbi:cytochrome c [Paraburkholderia fungorum]|uniref:c-type cytochrome n=1 Tax=Paraburkholderia fungorum TaxID=134537 RepID=UPI0033143FA5